MINRLITKIRVATGMALFAIAGPCPWRLSLRRLAPTPS